MKFGVVLPTYRNLASPDNIVRVAVEAERLELDSVWVTDHIVIPEASASAFGSIFYEAITTMAYIAALTERVAIGAAILVVPYRHPLLTAKMLATVDQFSRGRVILGAGLGWLEQESGLLGVDFKHRASVTDEALQAMRSAWTNPRPVFAGRHFRFDALHFEPGSCSPGGIPTWIGGVSDKALHRAATLGHGWISDGQTFDEIRPCIRRLHESLEAHGRDPKGFVISLRTGLQVVEAADEVTRSRGLKGWQATTDAPESGRIPFRGTLLQVVEDVLEAERLGIGDLIFEFPVARGEESLDLMAQLAEIRRRTGR